MRSARGEGDVVNGECEGGDGREDDDKQVVTVSASVGTSPHVRKGAPARRRQVRQWQFVR